MEILWPIIAIGICIFGYYLYDFRCKSGRYWKNRGIPVLNGALPFIGHMWPIITAREGFIFLYNRFYTETTASMFGVYNFRQPILVIRDPEIIKVILVNSFSNFEENASKLDPQLDPLLSTNPFYTHGDKWKSQRTIFQSALTNKQLRVIGLQINDVCSKFDNYLTSNIAANGGKIVVDAQEMFSYFTAEVVAIAAFGIDGKSFSDDPHSFHSIAKKMFAPSKLNEFIGSIALFFPILRRLLRVSFMPASVDQHFRKILEDVVSSRIQSDASGQGFLQRIIDIYRNEVDQENGDFIAGHAAAFFLDGYITSSLTMAFVSYYIAKHQTVQQKIREEAEGVLGKFEGRITFEALAEMKYLEQVIGEAMRLFPVLGYIGKICTRECRLIGSDGLECQVEPGTEVIIPAIGLQRDPAFWEEPEVFNPERFDDARKNAFHKFAYIPFGAGPRTCLGRRVAMMQMKAALVTLIKQYQVGVDSRTKEPVGVSPMAALFTIAENQIWIGIEKLNKINAISCPPVNPVKRGTLICSRPGDDNTWQPYRAVNRPGTKCYLKCPRSYQLLGEYQITCHGNGEWKGPQHADCVKDPKPRLECPKDVIAELPPGQNEAFVRFNQPSTDVDWFRYVKSKPSWGMRLEANLQLGLHIVTFFAKHPVSKKQSSCTLRIVVKEGEPPKAHNCPENVTGRNGSIITWDEPVFTDNVKVTQVTNNQTKQSDLQMKRDMSASGNFGNCFSTSSHSVSSINGRSLNLSFPTSTLCINTWIAGLNSRQCCYHEGQKINDTLDTISDKEPTIAGMLSISAPSKFVLTLQSVPPFFLESVLAFVLVILLAIPLIARVQMLLENPMNYFPPVTHKLPPTRPPPTAAALPPTPVISVNLQLDTIRPITPSTPTSEPINIDMQLLHPLHLTPFHHEDSLHLQKAPSETSTMDYEFYRHNFIEVNLKKQFGERIPGNVVFNAHHLSTMDSKVLLKVNRNFQHDLFDFIEYPEPPKPAKPHPTDLFLPKNTSKNVINLDKSIGTMDPSLEQDQVPELIDFKDRGPTPTSPRSPRRLRQLAESADDVQRILNPKPPKKKLESTSSLPGPPAPEKQSNTHPRVLRAKETRQVVAKHRSSLKDPPKPAGQNIEKTEDLFVKNQRESGHDRSSITCPSVASSEAFSINSASSKQPERIASRPTSSCGSTKGFKNFRSRVNSRPRSSGFFGWEIPDSPDASDTAADDPVPVGLDYVDRREVEKDTRSTENPARSKANSSENKERTDKPMFEAALVPQPHLDALNDVTAERDQSSFPSHARNAEEKMHKSRLPVRRSEQTRKVAKKNSSDKSGREFKKKEDVTLQASASVIKSGIDDNSGHSFGDRTGVLGRGEAGGECNQELPGERTMGGETSKEKLQGESMKLREINTSNREDQVKSGGGEVVGEGM